MSTVVRLTLVSHAMTDAMAAGRFPADEPLNDLGRRQAKAVAQTGFGARHFAAPEQRAQETARLLGLDAAPEPLLADIDCGLWQGKTIEDVRAEDLTVWLTDPARAPHGGESITALTQRVGGWLDSLTQDASAVVAVTHPAVIRTAILLALDASAKSFWRIDIAPVSRIAMHFRGGCWTLRW